MIEFRNKADAKITQDYKPDDKIQFDRQQVYKRYTDMKNGRIVNGKSLESLWDKWEKQYEAWRPAKSEDDWQSDIVPPFTTTIVERALSEIVGQTIRPIVAGRGEEDKMKAKLMNHIVDYTWEVGDGDLQIQDTLKSMLVLGKAIWQEDYWIDKRVVKVLKKFDPEKQIEDYEEKTIYDYNDVYGECINLRDFFIDPAAKTINRGRYKAKDCIRRYIMGYDAFMESFKDSIWDQFKATKYVKPTSVISDAAEYYQFYSPVKGMSDDEVEILFYWSRYPDKLIILANDIVIRDGPNPYNHKQLPFAEASDVKRLNGFWARGEPELLESIQDELTTIRRMRLDQQHLNIFSQFLVSNRETLDDENNIIHPSSYIPVDDPNAVKQVDHGQINTSSYQEEGLLKEDGRQVTGVLNPQPSGTATEAAINKESTMKTLQLKVWNVCRELLVDVLRLRVPNIIQYYSAPNIERILGDEADNYRRIVTQDVALEMTADGQMVEKKSKGENFFDVKPEYIIPLYTKYDIRLTSEPTFPLSKPLLQQKVGEFMQHPVFQAAVANGYYDVGKSADKLSEINDFDPDDFKAEAEGQGQGQAIDPAVLLEMANRENEAFLKGKALSGTPYATSEHTGVHLAFISSPKFIQALKDKPEIGQNIAKHIMEEDAAIKMRGQGSPDVRPEQNGLDPMSPGSKGDVGGGIMQGEAKASMPGRMVGSEGVPNGLNG